MHAYLHHIKDFNNATRHLTRVERSLYRDAIELYYETEQPLPANDFDRLARRLMAFTDEEKAALRTILDEFFDLTGDVYSHDRCDEEIEKFRDAKTAKSAAGKASAAARRHRAEQRKQQRKEQNPTGVEQVLNPVGTDEQQNPTNQEPITFNQKKDQNTSSPAATNSRFEEFWQAYPKKRGKHACATKWKAKRLDAKADDLIADVQKRRTQDRRWLDGFIPDPLTYLNQERWEDEVEPKDRGGSSAKVTQLNPRGLASRALN